MTMIILTMAKRKRKTRDYNISGIVEVINITKGRRTTTFLDLDAEKGIKKVEISGSIVTKSPIYDEDAHQIPQTQEIYSKRSGDER